MKNAILFLLLLGATTVTAQKNGRITGKLVDGQMNGEPILFATIALKNSSYQTQSNLHGNFELNTIGLGEHTLVMSALGYETIEVTVNLETAEPIRIHREMKPLSISTSGLLVSALADENAVDTKEK